MKRYKVQVTVTATLTTFVDVEGEFKDPFDIEIDNQALEKVKAMNLSDMSLDSREYRIEDVYDLE
jgi:hypothetical protein